MRIAYISGPYRADAIWKIHANIERARQAAMEYWRWDWAVICPHLNSGLMDGFVPDEQFLNGDMEFIRRLGPGDAIVMLPGWSSSEGSRRERDLAVERGLLVMGAPE